MGLLYDRIHDNDDLFFVTRARLVQAVRYLVAEASYVCMWAVLVAESRWRVPDDWWRQGYCRSLAHLQFSSAVCIPCM